MARHALLMILLPALLAGCGLKRVEHPDQREIPPGPGMLSGEDGGLVYSGDPLGLQGDREEETSPAPGRPDEPQAGAAAAGAPSGFSDYREFMDYQAFQRWKETARGSAEYREFQDWRMWQRYRRWQRQKSQ